jgi:hypothetical protein
MLSCAVLPQLALAIDRRPKSRSQATRVKIAHKKFGIPAPEGTKIAPSCDLGAAYVGEEHRKRGVT